MSELRRLANEARRLAHGMTATGPRALSLEEVEVGLEQLADKLLELSRLSRRAKGEI